MDTLKKLKWIHERCGASVHLTFDQHKAYYETVELYLADACECRTDIVGCYDTMVVADTVVEMRAYPNTPIGSVMFFAEDLEQVVDACYDYLQTSEIG